MSEIGIRLENIGVFRGVREFKLAKGLNLIYAPNAAGKTSLIAGLKAVTISALTPSELTRVLNDYEERGSVKLEIDDDKYIVNLIRRPDGVVEARGRRLTDNGVIKKLTFIDLENELVGAVYAGDEERLKEMLREISGIVHVETILTAVEGLKAEYEYEYEVQKREYESRKDEIRKQIEHLEKRLEKTRTRIMEILRDPRIEPARREVEEIRRQLENLERQEHNLRREESRINNVIGLRRRDYLNVKAELEAIKDRYDRLSEEYGKLKSKLIDIRRKIEKLQKEKQALEEKKNRLKMEQREKESLLGRRKSILEYAECPYCGSPINKDVIMKEVTQLRETIDKLRSEIAKIDKEIARKEAEINELKISGEERLKSLEEELTELSKRIAMLERDRISIERELGELEQKLREIQREIDKIEEQRQVLIKRLEIFGKEAPLIEELRRLQEEEHRLSQEWDYLHGRLMQLDQLYEEVLVLGNKVETLKLLSEYFRIRLNELKKVVVNRINEAVLKHFKLLSLAELEYPILTEDFSLRLVRAGGIPTTLAELSDAEKAILTILVTVALKDFVAESFPFYVIDTLIEFIDDTRAKEVLKYLMEIADGRTVVIVTKTRPYSGEPRLLSQEDILVNEIITT